MDLGGSWVFFSLSLPKINPPNWGENIGEKMGINIITYLLFSTLLYNVSNSLSYLHSKLTPKSKPIISSSELILEYKPKKT